MAPWNPLLNNPLRAPRFANHGFGELVATYDLKPEMSAFEIRDAIIPEINSNSSDFICLNFANPDMVGHTGNFNAAVKACETVDTCLREIVESSINKNYSIIILSLIHI